MKKLKQSPLISELHDFTHATSSAWHVSGTQRPSRLTRVDAPELLSKVKVTLLFASGFDTASGAGVARLETDAMRMATMVLDRPILLGLVREEV